MKCKKLPDVAICPLVGSHGPLAHVVLEVKPWAVGSQASFISKTSNDTQPGQPDNSQIAPPTTLSLTHTYTHILLHSHIHTHSHSHLYLHMHIHIYTYIYTPSHTYTHTHTNPSTSGLLMLSLLSQIKGPSKGCYRSSWKQRNQEHEIQVKLGVCCRKGF